MTRAYSASSVLRSAPDAARRASACIALAGYLWMWAIASLRASFLSRSVTPISARRQAALEASSLSLLLSTASILPSQLRSAVRSLLARARCAICHKSPTSFGRFLSSAWSALPDTADLADSSSQTPRASGPGRSRRAPARCRSRRGR